MTLEEEFLKSKTEESQKKSIKLGVKLKKVPPGAKMKDVKALFSGSSVKNVIFQKGAAALVVFTSEQAVEKALAMKTASLGGHSVLIRPLPQLPEASGKTRKHGTQREFFPQRNQKEMEKEVEETGRLYFRNLPYGMTETHLDGLCSPYGLLAEAFVPWDSAAGRNRGFGFVSFVHPAEAVRAFRALDKKEAQGRKLHILPGKEATGGDPLEEEEEEAAKGAKTAFQRDRLAKRKRAEGTRAAERTWNPLLVNATALAEVQASELGVNKEHLLDNRTRGSAAVRLAQLELALMGDLEAFLKEQGAHVPSLRGQEEEGRVVRSRNAFLIKNLPAFTKEEELEPLVSRHGELEGLKMAPKGLLAIVRFRQSVQARRAFAHLAFVEFKDSVLKVEWLPQLQTEFAEEEKETAAEEDEEKEEASPAKKQKTDAEEISKKSKKAAKERQAEEEKQSDGKKRKQGKRREEELEEAEEETRPPKKKSRKSKEQSEKSEEEKEAEPKKKSRKSKEQSEKPEEEAEPKKKSRKSKELPEMPEEEQEAEPKKKSRKSKEQSEKPKDESAKKSDGKPKKADEGCSSTVVLVRNVPFQANRKELEELFRPFGTLARVRLPVKPGGGIRGFAFAEFADEESAQALLAADKRMHLYGRRLRLEPALTETAVSKVREQAFASLTGAMEAEQQRKRKSKLTLQPELPEDTA